MSLQILMPILLALLPVGILLFYINYRDKASPEPPMVLLEAFKYGVLSVSLSFVMSIPFGVIGLYPAGDPVTVLDAVRKAFFAAAIPEECAKLFMLWLVLRNNPYFDEKMDGIVYAVCVSLGFAALENILYLFDSDNFISTGIIRAIFAIPGHFCFGVLMGYYYSLAKFYPNTPKKNWVLVLIAPVIAHGLYDTILMSAKPAGTYSILISLVLSLVVFPVFCYKMWRYASKRIAEHLERD